MWLFFSSAQNETIQDEIKLLSADGFSSKTFGESSIVRQMRWQNTAQGVTCRCSVFKNNSYRFQFLVSPCMCLCLQGVVLMGDEACQLYQFLFAEEQSLQANITSL